MKAVRILILCTLLAGVLGSSQAVVARAPGSGPEVSSLPEGISTAQAEGFWPRWTPRQELSSPLTGAIFPTISASSVGESVYAAWSRAVDLSRSDIYYTVSGDGGSTWAGAQTVDPTAVNSIRPSMPVAFAAAPPDVVWSEQVAAGSTSYALRKGKLGIGPYSDISNAYSMRAVASLDSGPGGEVHLAAHGGAPGPSENPTHLLYSRKKAGVWSATTLVYAGTATSDVQEPALAVSANGQAVHLVWQQSKSTTENYIYYMRGTLGEAGITPGAVVTLSTGYVNSVSPAIALGSDGTVHVIFAEYDPTGAPEDYEHNVRYTRLPPGGSNWTTPLPIGQSAIRVHRLFPTQVHSAMAIAPNGVICVAWHGYYRLVTDSEEIYVSCSKDDGDNWEAPVNVSNNGQVVSIYPTIAVDGDSIFHLAWQEDFKIYYAHSIPHTVLLPFVTKNK